MNITGLDLNLLRVFDALSRRGSVSAAALELGLSQPAVSNALRRLRDATGDELFLRTRRGMEPTPYAQAIRLPVAEGLATILSGLQRGAVFDPGVAQRRFRLLMTDAGEVVVLPRLMALLRVKAPQIELVVTQLPIERYFEALESDEVDVAVGNLHPREGSLVLRPLFNETYVILCRQDHPWTTELPDQERYLAARHIAVSPPSSRSNAIRDLAVENRWRMRASLTVPHFMVLAPIIERTGLVATVPTRVAAELCRRHPLAVVPLPFTSPTIKVSIGWHMRQQKDQGRRWLFEAISASLAQP